MQKLLDKYLDKIRTSTLSEQNIISLRSALNAGKFPPEEILAAIKLSQPVIGPEQSQKGLNWLLNQWRTPTGKVRKHNPFSPRETNVLQDFAGFRLVNLHDQANEFRLRCGMHNYKPVYRVIAKNGRFFDYVSGPGEPVRIVASGSVSYTLVDTLLKAVTL